MSMVNTVISFCLYFVRQYRCRENNRKGLYSGLWLCSRISITLSKDFITWVLEQWSWRSNKVIQKQWEKFTVYKRKFINCTIILFGKKKTCVYIYFYQIYPKEVNHLPLILIKYTVLVYLRFWVWSWGERNLPISKIASVN